MNYKEFRKYFDKAVAFDFYAGSADLFLNNGNKVSADISREWKARDFVNEVNARKLPRRQTDIISGYTSQYEVSLNLRA